MKNLKVKVCNNLFLNATTSFKKNFSKALRHYFVITYRFLIKQFQVLACNAFANKTIFKTKDCETGFTKITIVQQKCHSICMILMSLTEQLRHRSAKCSRHTFSVITFALVLGMVHRDRSILRSLWHGEVCKFSSEKSVLGSWIRTLAPAACNIFKPDVCIFHASKVVFSYAGGH